MNHYYKTPAIKADSRSSIRGYRLRKLERSWKWTALFILMFPFFVVRDLVSKPKPEVSVLAAVGISSFMGLTIVSV